MGSIEAIGNSQEKQLSDAEQTEVEFFKNWYADAKQNQPDASEADFRKTIVSGLGYRLGIPGYGLDDQDNPDAKPTEEQQARLEELYEIVVGKEETTGWENMAEDVEKAKKQLSDTEQTEVQLSDAEQTEVEFFKDWYAKEKQKQPDASGDYFRKTIVSGLGYTLGIPGYRLRDQDNPDAKPTEEQQARLEELYEIVVGKEKSE